MRNWFMNMAAKYRAFMYGRYGNDEFSNFISWTVLLILVAGIFLPILNIFALILLGYWFFRTFSKNIPARMRELEKFKRTKKKTSQFLKRNQNRFKERKTHRYFKCRNCKTYLRVPKGKGKIEITCPMCKTKTTKTT